MPSPRLETASKSTRTEAEIRASRMPPLNAAKPAAGETCRECVMGLPIYIPCGKPAEFIIENQGEVVPMCRIDADHNVRNRGAHYQVVP